MSDIGGQCPEMVLTVQIPVFATRTRATATAINTVLHGAGIHQAGIAWRGTLKTRHFRRKPAPRASGRGKGESRDSSSRKGEAGHSRDNIPMRSPESAAVAPTGAVTARLPPGARTHHHCANCRKNRVVNHGPHVMGQSGKYFCRGDGLGHVDDILGGDVRNYHKRRASPQYLGETVHAPKQSNASLYVYLLCQRLLQPRQTPR